MTTPVGFARLDVPALLAALTVDEKISLLDGEDFWHTTGIERLGIPSLLVSDGPHGLRTQASEADHLGLNHSIPATCFPPAAGIASSWDRDLLTRVGEALGRECRALGVSVLLGPGVNIKRSPLCGRNFEYFSEDPLLAGSLGAAIVAGVQSQGVGTSVKHFAANNQETDRMTISADIDERTLREIYLAAFEPVITVAKAWTVMSSYNRINGMYASESPWLLTDVLRGDWGFDGLVMSDWGGVNDRPDALVAGLDLEMPASGGNGAGRLRAAFDAGQLTEADLDRGVRCVLELVDRAIAAAAVPAEPVDVDAHHALARAAATASVVLLKNEGGILPLDPTGGTVAVIGEFARTPRFQGAGSSQVNPTRVDNALNMLREGYGAQREITFAPGFVIDAEQLDPALVEDAVQAAQAADTVVLFLGLPPSYESEGYDRAHMNLPAAQIELLETIAAVNERIVVVLANGASVTVTPWIDKAQAVLEGWFGGQAAGAALADLLTGAANPSGRLAETLPVRLEHNPSFGSFPGEHGHVRYGEGLLVGYRWYDTHALPVAFPFGFGLSYTTFAYSDLTVEATDGADPSVTVSVTVTNTGDRAGSETVQLYVADPTSTVQRPDQELRAFARVELAPGEQQAVTLELGRRAFAFWHVPGKCWAIEGGDFEIRVGSSSRHIHATATVTLAGDDIVVPLQPDSTLEAWLHHGEAGPWIREALVGSFFESMIFDPVNGEMFRAIPLQRLSRMPGFPVVEEQVDAAVSRFS